MARLLRHQGAALLQHPLCHVELSSQYRQSYVFAPHHTERQHPQGEADLFAPGSPW